MTSDKIIIMYWYEEDAGFHYPLKNNTRDHAGNITEYMRNHSASD